MQNIFLVIFFLTFLIFGCSFTSSTSGSSPSSNRTSSPDESIKSTEIVDQEAEKYFRTIFSNLSSLKFKYGKYGGEITNLTLWNRLSAQEKVAYGKAFCNKWEPGQKLYDVVTIASAFGGENHNPLKAGMGESPDFDTLAEASTIIDASMIVFCKDKYSRYLLQQSRELMK
jgi:hypothetical protein